MIQKIDHVHMWTCKNHARAQYIGLAYNVLANYVHVINSHYARNDSTHGRFEHGEFVCDHDEFTLVLCMLSIVNSCI